MKAALILEDGTALAGEPFGAEGEAFGEAVFYTGVVGYQEVVTDPSYARAVVVMTYPIIGSYGVNAEDNESPRATASALVVRELSRTRSNFRATGALEDFLKERGVVGIREVDTRAAAVLLRERGEMRASVCSGEFDPAEVAARLKATPSPFASDLVRDLTWEGVRPAAGEERCRIAVLNLGAKEGLLAQLAELGCAIDVLRCDASADDVLAKGPKGVIVAGGPGDPCVLGYAVATVKAILGKAPLLGIGLGHQVLALALGCEVDRMKTGHRGVNYPVREPATGRCQITTQSHSFVVSGEALPSSVEVTHVNVNDGTVEGIASRDADARSVQFHPGRDDMERPSAILREFCGVG